MPKIIAFSDIHIGQNPDKEQPRSYDEFLKFLDWVKTEAKPDHVLLVGDILELIWCSWEDIKDHEALKALKDMASAIDTRYLCGNHDNWKDLKDHLKDLEPLHVIGPLSTDPKKPPEYIKDDVVFTHGYQFDRVDRIWSLLLSIPRVKSLTRLGYGMFYHGPSKYKSDILNLKKKNTRDIINLEKKKENYEKIQKKERSYTKKIQKKERGYTVYVGTISSRAEVAFSQKERGEVKGEVEVKKMVFGHTHAPYRKRLVAEDLVVANCGDWRDSITFVEVKDGNIEVKEWSAVRGHSQLGTKAL